MFCNRLNSEQLCRNRLFEDSASNMVKTEVKVKSENLPFCVQVLFHVLIKSLIRILIMDLKKSLITIIKIIKSESKLFLFNLSFSKMLILCYVRKLKTLFNKKLKYVICYILR